MLTGNRKAALANKNIHLPPTGRFRPMPGPPKHIVMCKEAALAHANMLSIPHDREVSSRRLNYYRRQWDLGEFRFPEWSTCYDRATKLTYRTNGRTTATMLSLIENMPLFYAILTEYEAENFEGVVANWNSFDSRLAARTGAELIGAVACCIAGLENVPKNVLTSCVSGICYGKYLERAWDNAVHPPLDRAEELFDYDAFAIWYASMVTGKHTKLAAPLKRAGVAAIMFRSFQKDAKAADKFWPLVRDEQGEVPELPQRKLSKFLLTHFSFTGGGAQQAPKDKTAIYREFAVKSAQAWNGWREGKIVKLKFKPGDEIPELI